MLSVGVPIMEINSKYLGLPSIWGHSKGQALNFIIDRVRSKLSGWKQNFISQAGRKVLIKAVVRAVPSFAMACFALPSFFCKKLSSLVLNFWWGVMASIRKLVRRDGIFVQNLNLRVV